MQFGNIQRFFYSEYYTQLPLLFSGSYAYIHACQCMLRAMPFALLNGIVSHDSEILLLRFWKLFWEEGLEAGLLKGKREAGKQRLLWGNQEGIRGPDGHA